MSEKIKRIFKEHRCNRGMTGYASNRCREVQIASMGTNIGDVIEGFNTISNKPEKWVVIQINKTDKLLQKMIPKIELP